MSLKYATSIADVSDEDLIDLRQLAEWLRDYADPELSIIEDEDEKVKVAEQIAEDLELVRGMLADMGYRKPEGGWEWMADTLQEHGDSREPTLIRESYWLEYVKDYAEEDYANANDTAATWPYNHIDWEAAADELDQDYIDVELNGVTYKIRSS